MSAGPCVVVVGASVAGLRAVEAIRLAGFEGAITLVGAEQHFPPFSRPMLSKQLLASDASHEVARLRTASQFDADVRVGRPAVGLNVSEQRVSLADGTSLRYDGLVIATGAAPRALPGTPDLDGIHTLRTVDDCLRLRAELDSSRRVVVIGASFVGAEVAASCRARGIDVAVVDALAEPMERVLGPRVGSRIRQLHERNGVAFVLGSAVDEWLSSAGRFAGVRLADGRTVAGDVAVVGVGTAPQTEWLAGSGLAIDNGVVCDETCFAYGVDNVVAAGDVARWRHPVLAEMVRVEHWTNAAAQAQRAGRNLAARLSGTDDVVPYSELPYFWSDQYDWKMKFVGQPGVAVTIVEENLAEGRFVADYMTDGRLVGVLCANLPRELTSARQRILDSHARIA